MNRCARHALLSANLICHPILHGKSNAPDLTLEGKILGAQVPVTSLHRFNGSAMAMRTGCVPRFETRMAA